MLLDENLFETKGFIRTPKSKLRTTTLAEATSSKLSFHDFLKFLDSIGSSYSGFTRVHKDEDGKRYYGYRYTLTTKLTDEQKRELTKYSNVEIGDATYRYAPEISYSTVVLIDRIINLKNRPSKPMGSITEKKEKSSVPDKKYWENIKETVKGHIKEINYLMKDLDSDKDKKLIDKYNSILKNYNDALNTLDSRIEPFKESADSLLNSNKNESFEDEHLGEVSEKEFTVTAVDKNGSTYLGRVKAKDNKEAEDKFLAYKDNKDLQIAGSHETTPDEIRKGVRLIEDMEMVPETPTVGPELGIAGVINSLIIDEFEAIDGYNSAIATAEQEGMTDIINVLKDIANEENLHVGQLQTCLAKVSPNATSIDAGQTEAQQQLNDGETI